ncbi:Fe2+-dependent dioxygenase [Thiomicrorhabdus sp. 6S2-11]|uniref:Fe2+-dependent dioxygenase n=1 Tax=Thiomicrorhabdus marina TaxID=2818442 RepID=A0ABS3Q686_9GAMM|nr:Fe2+-dependent dioxygenase [Thiomicrorhabdus marina]MBO1927853.1 Fe2+-dependent dioxygenase [Thiomicrorhabdus marina]
MFKIIEQVFSQEECQHILQELEQGEWIDGAHTAGSLAKRVKQNLQFDDHNDDAQALSKKVESRLLQIPEFVSNALPNKFYPPKFNLYQNGGFYGAHVDNAVLHNPYSGEQVRADLSATLFLNSPESYLGGELQIDTGMGVQEIKLNAGDMILYDSGALHQVLPVTEGQRIASFMWVQSLVQDGKARMMLAQLDSNIQALRQELGDEHDSVLQLTELYHNLLRYWTVS